VIRSGSGVLSLVRGGVTFRQKTSSAPVGE